MLTGSILKLGTGLHVVSSIEALQLDLLVVLIGT